MPRVFVFAALAALAALIAPRPAAQPALADTLAAADSAAAAPARAAATPYAPLPPALAGMLWARPDSLDRALADLAAMRDAGVRTVRTTLIEDEALLTAADRLGIALVQDLPVADLSAVALADTLAGTARLFAEALARARPHPSARTWVLAQGVDTSDPRSRAYFEPLAALARERGAAGTRTAYVTRFVEDDRAHEAVDLVLLDARGADPFAGLARWRAAHATPVGLGAYGESVVPGRGGGWRTPGSEERQARTLELALGRLLTLADPPAVALLAEWADRDGPGPRYGLTGEDGPRPALRVARGLYTGERRTFAFDAGGAVAGARRPGWLVMLGWLLVLSIGGLLMSSPRLSTLVPRYFGRRDLYREAVQKGYDLSTGIMVALAAVLALAVGAVLASALRALGRTGVIGVAISGRSADAQARLLDLLDAPFALVFVLGTAYAVWLLLSVMWLGVVSGRRRLRPAQALTLAVWPRWPWLLLLLGAMVLTSSDGGATSAFAAALLLAGLLVETVAAYRMLLDLAQANGVTIGRALGLGFLVPVVLALAGIGWAVSEASGAAGFVWHLATRS